MVGNLVTPQMKIQEQISNDIERIIFQKGQIEDIVGDLDYNCFYYQTIISEISELSDTAPERHIITDINLQMTSPRKSFIDTSPHKDILSDISNQTDILSDVANEMHHNMIQQNDILSDEIPKNGDIMLDKSAKDDITANLNKLDKKIDKQNKINKPRMDPVNDTSISTCSLELPFGHKDDHIEINDFIPLIPKSATHNILSEK